MTRNAVIVLVGIVVYMCSSLRDIEAAPGIHSVFDEMKIDNQTCPAGNPFRDSKYAKICKTVKYPSGNITLNSNNAQLFLCLGLYDRIIRLCYLDTLSTTQQSVLPDDVSQFDEAVAKDMPKSESDIAMFCSKWNNDYPPRYAKTRPYVAQLETALKKSILRLKFCTDAQGEFIPLCLVVAKMDQMAALTGVVSDNVEKTQKGKQESQTQVAVQHSTQQNQMAKKTKDEAIVGGADTWEPANNQKNVNSPDNSPNESSKVLPKDSKIDPNLVKPQQEEHEKTSHGGPLPATQSKQPDVESKQQAENLGTKINAPVSAANLPEIKSGNDELKEKVKPEKKKQTEKQTVEEASQTKTNLSNNAKASDSPVPPIDVAGVPQNPGTSGEDVSAIGDVMDQPKTGVISQHTQDEPEDQFGDGDPLEAIEPLLPDDDVEQNSLLPSEKREYIPHMARIPNDDDSHFFGYFTVIGVICIAGYVGYHNKQKILAMVVEGRRSRGGRSRKRPSTANYRKLDCTLEEAVTSQCNSNVTHVIY